MNKRQFIEVPGVILNARQRPFGGYLIENQAVDRRGSALASRKKSRKNSPPQFTFTGLRPGGAYQQQADKRDYSYGNNHFPVHACFSFPVDKLSKDRCKGKYPHYFLFFFSYRNVYGIAFLLILYSLYSRLTNTVRTSVSAVNPSVSWYDNATLDHIFKFGQ